MTSSPPPGLSDLDPDLVAQVCGSTGLTPGEASRLIHDVLAYYAEPVEDVVRRRHRALQLRGLRNEAIFEVIAAELRERVVVAPPLSTRQPRRIVYG